MDKIDRMILAELKTITGNNKIKNKDVMEWSTSEATVKKNLREGEKHYHLPNTGVHVAVKEAK